MTIAESLKAFQPQLEESYKSRVENLLKSMTDKLGPSLKNIFNDWDFARVFTSTVRASVRSTAAGYVIDDSALARNAQQFAIATIAEWEEKIAGKIAGIEQPAVSRLSGTSFLITGQRAGRAVSIEQHMILNVSSRGKLFNQFPARIYVDGKFTSEAKYKAL